MNRISWLVLLAVAASLTACGSGGGGGGGGGGDDDYSFTYTMTATAGEFAIGRYVVVVNQPTTGDATCNAATAAIIRSKQIVTIAGQVAVHVQIPKSTFKNYYIETIYVDVDASNNLNNGDLDMGTSGAGFGAFCNQVGTDNVSASFDWDTLQGVAFGGGPSTWTGGSKTFSAEWGESDLRPASVVNNLGTLEGVVEAE